MQATTISRIVNFELPWPPSVNHLYGFRGKTKYVRKQGVCYQRIAFRLLHQKHGPQFVGPLELEVFAHPPDRRKRDLDNLFKILLDSIVRAGVVKDDSQFVKLTIERMKCKPSGLLCVTIKERTE